VIWPQRYDPLHSPLLSTAVAALPVIALLGSLAWLRLRAPLAALIGLVTALLIAVAVLGMPGRLALASAAYGAAYGLLPIGWIVLNVIFLYQLVERRGLLDALRQGVQPVAAGLEGIVPNSAAAVETVFGDANAQTEPIQLCFKHAGPTGAERQTEARARDDPPSE